MVQPRPVGAVHHVVGEEPVAALVLHFQHEGIVLGTVVGVVEGRGYRVLVRGICLAVRVRRQERDIFGHVGAKCLVACALRIADEDALQRVARSAFRLRGEHHAHNGVAVLAELGISLELHGITAGRHIDSERHVPSYREVIGPDRRSIGACAKGQRGHDVRRQNRSQGLRGENGAGTPPSTCGWRDRRNASTRRAAPGGDCGARHDARVAPDDHRRRARAGSHVREEDMHFLRTRRGWCTAAAPAAPAHSIREVMRRLDLQRLVVERQWALVAGAAGGEIAAGKKPARPGGQVLLYLVAAGATLAPATP